MSARSLDCQAVNPVPGVKYRIQSVEFLTCLELFEPTATDVVLRPVRRTTRQYWEFEQVPGSSRYKIRNVSNSDHYLALSDDDDLLHTSKNSSKNSLATMLYKDGTYLIAFLWDPNNIDYCCCTEDNKANVNVSKTINLDHDTCRWRLVPVASHLLQPGYYRIRNFNGKSLLTMPKGRVTGNANVYVQSQLNQSLYQRWIVNLDPSTNHYTIQNTGNNLYLGDRASIAATGDSLTGLQTMFLWDIQSVGGFAWSLCVPGTEMSVGVADNCIDDENEICLVPSDTTSTQIWFLEKHLSVFPYKVHAKREVEEGNYFLQIAFDDSIYMKAISSPWHITMGADPTIQFNLKYVKETSTRFTLTCVTKTAPAPAVTDLGGYIGLSLKGTEFVLLEKDEGHPGYVICCADEIGEKVISGRIVTDINNNSALALDCREAGQLDQMWVFVPA